MVGQQQRIPLATHVLLANDRRMVQKSEEQPKQCDRHIGDEPACGFVQEGLERVPLFSPSTLAHDRGMVSMPV